MAYNYNQRHHEEKQIWTDELYKEKGLVDHLIINLVLSYLSLYKFIFY